MNSLKNPGVWTARKPLATLWEIVAGDGRGALGVVN
jgi:hypothetical protein